MEAQANTTREQSNKKRTEVGDPRMAEMEEKDVIKKIFFTHYVVLKHSSVILEYTSYKYKWFIYNQNWRLSINVLWDLILWSKTYKGTVVHIVHVQKIRKHLNSSPVFVRSDPLCDFYHQNIEIVKLQFLDNTSSLVSGIWDHTLIMICDIAPWKSFLNSTV